MCGSSPGRAGAGAGRDPADAGTERGTAAKIAGSGNFSNAADLVASVKKRIHIVGSDHAFPWTLIAGDLNFPVDDRFAVFYDIVYFEIAVGLFYGCEPCTAGVEHIIDVFAQFSFPVFDVQIVAEIRVGIQKPELLIVHAYGVWQCIKAVKDEFPHLLVMAESGKQQLKITFKFFGRSLDCFSTACCDEKNISSDGAAV